MNTRNQIKPLFSLPFWAFVLLANLPVHAQEKPINFNRDIRPILSDKCFYCHGPDPEHREADLRLDTQEAAHDYAIVPGNPNEGDLFARITSADVDERMPPVDSGKELSATEITLFKRWIEQGAEYDPFWAYVPPKRHPAPKVENKDWSKQWIDQFIYDRLKQEGLTPSPEADRVTLMRRVYFDITGLPPSAEEVKQFVKNKDPQAYSKLVDRLLASDQYGERMATYWLDLVRFADTVGYHGDQDQNITPYRDWVIDAFNDNMRFDQFTAEQLAGDLLPNSGIDQKIATGYNRLLQTSHEGGVQPKEYLAIYAADRVRNFSNVWMGATIGCAQCHDHKFDPYTAKDFYSIVSFFADVDEAQHFKKGSNSLPTARPPELVVHTRREREAIAGLEAEIEALKADEASAEANKKMLDEKQAKLNSLKKAARKTMVTVAIEPRVIRVLPRGNWLDDTGEIVEPAIPEFMGTVKQGDDRATRLDLAKWLTDTKNGTGGLTARVFANRFWYLFFGVGISKTMDDLGGQGEVPVHPELLDNLAVEFYESGWDMKHMVKLIVMSKAYRQSSIASDELQQRDPYNRLYARQSRFRLPAEMIRDNALSISGLLNLEYGGSSVKPYQPAGYYQHMNFPTRKYSHHTDTRQWRRGVYVHWQRQFLHPMMKAFDAPSREECTAQRTRSNTPLAALVSLNDPTFVEAARSFAERILSEGGMNDHERLQFGFLNAVSRTADATELKLLNQLLKQERTIFSEHQKEAEKLIAIGQAKASQEVEATELAAWTAVARALLNLNETNTRN
ncbi:MAG: hypothetical protein COA78_03905 [Blastopirellula sp.]|nr:MAG: hypothetical protein COA78_03905 [Blastopirellula sp.]